jgi:hypothetical protein
VGAKAERARAVRPGTSLALRAPCDTLNGQRRCFKGVMDDAVAWGVTIETLTVPNTGAAAAKSSTTVYARMCFDPVLAQRFRSEHTEVRSTFDVAIGQPRCGIWPSEVKAGKASRTLRSFRDPNAWAF